jgi:hypothetical protein
MSIGFFTDKQKTPQPEEIAKAIGTAFPLWEELLTHIPETYRPQEDFKFLYGKNYGWGIRFRVRGKLLTCLYPARDHFKAQIILSPAEVDVVQAMDMGANVKQAIETATPYPEGRWLFIPVEGQTNSQDIVRILELHLKAKHNQVKA